MPAKAQRMASGPRHKILCVDDDQQVLEGLSLQLGRRYEVLTALSGSQALEILRIEAGIPRYGQDLAEDTLPLEAGILNALSFNKGCYIGQEIVERARSRGHVNWKLMGLRLEQGAPVPKPGEVLTVDGKTIGEVTSACFSPSLGRPVALAYVRREVSEPRTRLVLTTGSGAEVVQLPFFLNDGSREAGSATGDTVEQALHP